MIHFLHHLNSVFIKQWSLPFCAFFTTFTVVMTLLILSTDVRGHHYMLFNSTILWDFEESSQSSPGLCSLIRNKYIIRPQLNNEIENTFNVRPSIQLLKRFKKKKNGTFVELEANGINNETGWLERDLGWKGLLTQPHPVEFDHLKKLGRSKVSLAQVCISPTQYPKHAYFKNSSSGNKESLTPVPCFPLYSLLNAFSEGKVDLLYFNIVTAPIQVIKSLPAGRVKIDVISLLNHDNGEIYEDICCEPEMIKLLLSWGYRSANTCPSTKSRCYYVCSQRYCPFQVKL